MTIKTMRRMEANAVGETEVLYHLEDKKDDAQMYT